MLHRFLFFLWLPLTMDRNEAAAIYVSASISGHIAAANWSVMPQSHAKYSACSRHARLLQKLGKGYPADRPTSSK